VRTLHSAASFASNRWYTPRPDLDVATTIELAIGPDASALGLFVTAVWHP